jgi:serine/threonine protein kinase
MALIEKNKAYLLTVEYSEILERHRLSVMLEGQYIMVGERPISTDRKIYLSVVLSQIPLLLETLLPKLNALKLGFALIKDSATARTVLNGVFGHEHIGKVMIVYVPLSFGLDEVIDDLVANTSSFKGPSIPGHNHLGSIVYMETAGGGLNSLHSRKQRVVGGKYILLSNIKSDPKGNVWKGLYLGKYLLPMRCIIKEGRKLMISDEAGRDMKDRLKWQTQIHRELGGIISMSELIDFFEENGNTYVVLKWIDAKPLGKTIDRFYRGSNWQSLDVIRKIRLIRLLDQLISVVGQVHSQGYVHRDLSTANFLVKRSGRLYLIDWELAFDLHTQYPLPPFGFGTPGFTSPEQKRAEKPGVMEDIYGLSALMIVFFTGIRPVKLNTWDLDELRQFLLEQTGEVQLAKIISKGLSVYADERPDLIEFKEFAVSLLQRYKSKPLRSVPGNSFDTTINRNNLGYEKRA